MNVRLRLSDTKREVVGDFDLGAVPRCGDRIDIAKPREYPFPLTPVIVDVSSVQWSLGFDPPVVFLRGGADEVEAAVERGDFEIVPEWLHILAR